jgi:hypothetical protein
MFVFSVRESVLKTNIAEAACLPQLAKSIVPISVFIVPISVFIVPIFVFKVLILVSIDSIFVRGPWSVVQDQQLKSKIKNPRSKIQGPRSSSRNALDSKIAVFANSTFTMRTGLLNI